MPITWDKDRLENTEYSDFVTFSMNDCGKGQDIKVPIISGTELMKFIIDLCIKSKKRGRRLFPVHNPKDRDDNVLADIIREIFADCVGNLIAIWRYIWCRHQE